MAVKKILMLVEPVDVGLRGADNGADSQADRGIGGMVEERPEIAALIRRYVGCLEAQGIRVERVWLYGSRATDTAGPDSDVDIVVISPDFADKTHWDRAAITGLARWELFDATGWSVEALAKTPEEVASSHSASFLSGILGQAVSLYRRPGLRPTLSRSTP